jgi:GTP cyclohydrolase I
MQEVDLLLQMAGIEPIRIEQQRPSRPCIPPAAVPPEVHGRMVRNISQIYGVLLAGTGVTLPEGSAERFVSVLLRQTAGYHVGIKSIIASTRWHIGDLESSLPQSAGRDALVPADAYVRGPSTDSSAEDMNTSGASTTPSNNACSVDSSESDRDTIATTMLREWHESADGRVRMLECSAALDTTFGDGVCDQQALHLWSISFASQCEHHMLPFYGRLHIACPLGVASVSTECMRHLVDSVCCRLQVQERITHQVAEIVYEVTGHADVLVVCDAAHMCMVARGVEKHATSTMTTACRGGLQNDAGRLGIWLDRLHSALLC